VDPLARQVGKSSGVLGRREPLRLKAAHLARRGRAPVRRVAANDPAHRRIMAQTFGVVHILVPGEATKYRLSEHPANACRPFLPVRASARTSLAIAVKPSASSSSR